MRNWLERLGIVRPTPAPPAMPVPIPAKPPAQPFEPAGFSPSEEPHLNHEHELITRWIKTWKAVLAAPDSRFEYELDTGSPDTTEARAVSGISGPPRFLMALALVQRIRYIKTFHQPLDIVNATATDTLHRVAKSLVQKRGPISAEHFVLLLDDWLIHKPIYGPVDGEILVQLAERCREPELIAGKLGELASRLQDRSSSAYYDLHRLLKRVRKLIEPVSEHNLFLEAWQAPLRDIAFRSLVIHAGRAKAVTPSEK